MPPRARPQLALDAWAGQPLSLLAQTQQVRRKCVYPPRPPAHDALDQAFAPPADEPEQLLCWLPVTKPWLRQLARRLLLVCHRALRGVTELLAERFDLPVSLGTVHTIRHEAVATARGRNRQEDLAGIRLGAHDEIFQAGQPVLVGADVASTYGYLLRLEEHRDADTGGVRLREWAERGFPPAATIADFAGGLRWAQEQVLPQVPCRGDVFHALHTLTPLVRYLDNRAYDARAPRSHLERRPARTERRQGRKAASLAAQWRYARVAERQAVALADDVAVLVGGLGADLLAVAGPDYARRGALYDWIVAELRAREALCPHRVRPVRRFLENQGAELLAFVRQREQDLQVLAGEFAVPVAAVWEVVQGAAADPHSPGRWQRAAVLWQRWGNRYAARPGAVAAVTAAVVRARSVIENLNSRVRNYLFLRRHLGADYLERLRFFLNHRRFLRSERAARVGKSPAELLTGATQPHWLEQLGYTRITRN